MDPSPPTVPRQPLRLRDVTLLGVFSVMLFGVTMVSGRELSVHEAVLPQTARTMQASGDWIVPRRGEAPWLESPPLPQWITVALASPFGPVDRLWLARLAPTLMGVIAVLAVATMAAHWFGRVTGLLAGLVMATSYEVLRYASLAEDEIFLCTLVTVCLALFARLESSRGDEQVPRGGWLRALLGPRRPLLAVWFAVLGLTNLVKGLLFGPVLVLIPVATFLLWNRDSAGARRYAWLWGWLLFALVGFSWPVLAWRSEPGIVELWHLDLWGRLSGTYTQINEPPWYYLEVLPMVLAPWIVVAPLGFVATRHRALRVAGSPERLLWCWALGVPLVLSLSGGKHHHYLLPVVAPWAVLSTLGLLWLRDRLAPRWRARAPRIAVALFTLLGVGYGIGQWFHQGTHHHDGVFLRRVSETVPQGAPILADMDVGGLRGFHSLFYLPPRTLALHNLSFLADERIREEQVHVVTLMRNRSILERYGSAEPLAQSERTGRRSAPEDRLTLFRLRYAEGRPRVSAEGVRISPMQAMYRADGPFLDQDEPSGSSSSAQTQG